MAKISVSSAAAQVPLTAQLIKLPPPPPEMPYEVNAEIMASWAKTTWNYPVCNFPLDCGTPNSGHVNRTPHGPYYMPIGTFIVPFGFYFNVAQIPKDLKPFSIEVSDHVLYGKQKKFVFDKMAEISKQKFKDAHERFGVRATVFGHQADDYKSGIGPKDYSVNEFLKKNPDFITKWNDLEAPAPNDQEKTDKRKGLYNFIKRGGWFYSRGVVGGEVPLKIDFLPTLCDGYCRGCVTDYWPYGVPYCINERWMRAGSGWKWALFVTRRPGKLIVTVGRVPKSTLEKMNDGLSEFLSHLDKVVTWICGNHQTAASAAVASGDPQAAASAAGMSAYLNMMCPKPPTGPAPTVPTPPKPPTLSLQAVIIPPPQSNISKYPNGSIALFDPNTASYQVAVPIGLKAATEPTHREIEVVPSIPTNVLVVTRAEWDRATKPFWQRRSTRIGAVTAVSALAVAGGVVAVRRFR